MAGALYLTYKKASFVKGYTYWFTSIWLKPWPLGTFIYYRIPNQIAQAIIKDQGEVNNTQDSAAREMVRDLKELTSKGGKMDWESLQASSQAPDNYDKGSFLDQEMDRISLSFVFGDSPAPDYPPSQQVTLDEHKAWSKYKHHQFIQRWGLLSEDEGRDEEWWIADPVVILEARDGLLDPSLTLSHTIKDTIKVARAIGSCYLWVDALCILQDSTEDVAKNVTMMDKIYSGAALTIVASTNVSPYYGLPEVSTSPRSRTQITQTVPGMCVSTAFHDPRRRLDDIENSIWNTRAWTYQERHLSSRSVYFTDSEMVFIFPFATFFEDTVPANGLQYRPSPVNEGFNSYPRGVEMQIWNDPTQRIFPNKFFQTGDQTTTMVAVGPNQDGGRGPCSDPSPIYRIARLPGPHLSGIQEA
ncbi:hypothetical protein ASPVEDRAFT_23476 [Aspergillus versicolor CBS 583.65]|uniref:Heterokaryon incompatibility domain-containing protein n=1 Tax=Aspergillus versicolor CBS 583.65 TaxID=1036611 RepID=A0A1L9P4P1_ASPVE|nr:uncharacterized protein ASPVEDRAFT_23476 [Aspergillus versicolor CBS 583.65]OJI96466.1 hypothetical protein ASPVEDRAFT_23476 [Aspergillus versicolor CBS 583.65]